MAGTLLSYALSTDPDPLQASPVDGTISTGALTIVVSNNRDQPVYCSQIVFSFPEGTLAQDLTDNDADILASITPSALWQINIDGDGIYTATPQNGSAVEIKESGLVVVIYDIQINQEPGTVTLSISEDSSYDSSGPFDTSEDTLTVVKFPYGFFFDTFAPDTPQVADGGSVTLTWNGSDGPTYSLSWGSQSVDVTEVRTYTVGPLHADTTFLLQACYQYLGETQTPTLTTSVNVSAPELTLTSLVVNGGATVNSALTAGSAVVTGTLSGANSAPVDLSSGARIGGPLTLLGPAAALQPPQQLTLTSDGTGGVTFNNRTAAFVAGTDGFVVGSIYPPGAVLSPPCFGTIEASNSTGVFVSAALGPPNTIRIGTRDQSFYAPGSFVLPVRRNETFTVSSSIYLQNSVNPLVRFSFIPLGSGGATPTDPGNWDAERVHVGAAEIVGAGLSPAEAAGESARG